jgi:hypothetical protein
MPRLKDKNAVFFQISEDCLPHRQPEGRGMMYDMICLAEGLLELGIGVYATFNYWQQSLDPEDYLFRYDPTVGPEDCSIVVLDYLDWDESLMRRDRTWVTVRFDGGDGVKTPSWEPRYRDVDFIFRTHFSDRLDFPANFYPWAFGLSERIIQATSSQPNAPRKQQLLVNSRDCQRFPHSVRIFTRKQVIPALAPYLEINAQVDQTAPTSAYDRLQWEQTGRRHHPAYYQRLQESIACACFGGFFISPVPRDASSVMGRLLKRLISRLELKTNTIAQWDSWRLWETMAAGAVAIHVDFEKYGCQLPVMPVNWQHYIGVDLDHISETIDRLQDEPEILMQIGQAGRTWALEHYSPVAVAERLLAWVMPKLEEF